MAYGKYSAAYTWLYQRPDGYDHTWFELTDNYGYDWFKETLTEDYAYGWAIGGGKKKKDLYSLPSEEIANTFLTNVLPRMFYEKGWVSNVLKFARDF